MADLKFEVDYSQLSRAVDELTRMGKASKNTSTAFEQAFRLVRRWQDTFAGQQGRVNAELEKTALKLKLANKSAKESAQAFLAHEKAIEDNTNALNRMKMAYDSNYAVEQKTLSLKKLLRQEIANNNMTVRQAGAELAKYKAHLRSFNTAQMAATKASNRMGVVTQQAGYQVSDFIVQVQSGTNPFVAFSQQASQLVGILPLVAGNLGLTTTAAIGLSAALGIAIPIVGAIGAAIFTMGKKSSDSSNEVDSYTQSVKELTSAIKEWSKESAFLFSNEKEMKVFMAKREQEDLILKLSQITKGAVNANNYLSLLGNNEAFKKKVVEAGLVANEALEAVDIFKKLGKVTDEINTGEAALKGLENRREAKKIAEETLVVLGNLVDKDRERLQQQRQVNDSAKDSLRLLQQENAVLEAQAMYGKDSAEAEVLKNAHVVNNLKLELERLGVDEDIIAAIVEQKNMSLINQKILRDQTEEAKRLKKALEEAAGVQFISTAGNKYQALSDELALRAATGLGYVPPKTKTKTGSKKADPLGDLQKQLDLEKAMLGQTEARKRVMQALGDTYEKTSTQTISKLEYQIKTIEDAKKAEEDRLKVQQTVEASFEDGFMSMIDGTKTVSQAFRDMAKEIIAELMRIYVVKKAVAAITTFLPFADGGVFSGGSQVKAFANGGVVGGPTFFPMSGGKTGLMGEAGPEAIMPLKRGKDGKLGVAAEGGGGITINQTFAFQANGDESVKKIIAQEAPKIAQMTQQQILESRKRGGSFRKAFG